MRRPRAPSLSRFGLVTALTAIAAPAALAVAGPAPAAPAPATAPAPVPPGTPPGWRLVHTDDFSGGKLGRIWGRYGGPHGGAAASYYSADQVRVSGGLLRLRIADRPAGGRRYATGGVGSWNLVQTYGRYEFRARAPRGRGLDAYVTLWPQNQAPQQAALVEILARPGAERAYLSNEYGSGETNRTVSGRFSDGFHTYTIEWAPRSFRVLIDGKVRLRDIRSASARRWIGFALSSGDPLTGLPDAATRLPAEFQVDWVRIFAYDPKATGVPAAPRPAATRTPATGPATPRAKSAAPRPASVPPAPGGSGAADAGGTAGRSPSPAGPAVDAVSTSGSAGSGRFTPLAGAGLVLAGGAALAVVLARRGGRARPRR